MCAKALPRASISPTYSGVWSQYCTAEGLPHAGFTYEGNELTLAIVREGERPADLLDLSPRGGRVEPGPLRARSGERVDLHRLASSWRWTSPLTGPARLAPVRKLFR